MEAKQTSLIDLLERIPQGARLVVEHDQFSSSSHPVGRLCHEAAAALRAALAQQDEPVQEPVAWLYEAGADRTLHWHKPPLCGIPLYTAPPKPQTLDEALTLPRATAQAYERGYNAGAAAERERIIQFLREMQRQVGDGHNYYGVAAKRIREMV